ACRGLFLYIMKSPEQHRKPIEFTVPVRGDEAFYVMDYEGANFYEYYHRHREVQITYIVEGGGSFMLGNLIRPCIENQIFLIKPNDPHLFFKDEKIAGLPKVHVVHLFFSLEKLRPFFDMHEMEAIRQFLYDIDASKLLPAESALSLRELFLSLQMETGPSKLINVISIFKALVAHEAHFVSLYSGLNKVNFQDADGVRINTVIKYAIENYK